MILVQGEEEEEEAPEFVAEDEIEESDISDIEVGEHAVSYTTVHTSVTLPQSHAPRIHTDKALHVL